MLQCVLCKTEDLLLEFRRIFIKNGLQSSSRPFADAVCLLIGLLHKTEVLQCELDELVAEGPGNELFVGGVALAVVLLSGEGTPELGGNDADALVLGVFHEGEEVGGKNLDVGGGHVDEVVPDELEEGLHAEFQGDTLGYGLDELGY